MLLTIMLIGQACYIYSAPFFSKKMKRYEYSYLTINLSLILLIVLHSSNRIPISEGVLTLIALIIYAPLFVLILKRKKQPFK